MKKYTKNAVRTAILLISTTTAPSVATPTSSLRSATDEVPEVIKIDHWGNMSLQTRERSIEDPPGYPSEIPVVSVGPDGTERSGIWRESHPSRWTHLPTNIKIPQVVLRDSTGAWRIQIGYSSLSHATLAKGFSRQVVGTAFVPVVDAPAITPTPRPTGPRRAPLINISLDTAGAPGDTSQIQRAVSRVRQRIATLLANEPFSPSTVININIDFANITGVAIASGSFSSTSYTQIRNNLTGFLDLGAEPYETAIYGNLPLGSTLPATIMPTPGAPESIDTI